MGHWSKICLKIFLSAKIIVKGKENIDTNKKFLLPAHINQCSRLFFFKQFLILLSSY